jgi:hypothetical protein
MDRSSSWPRGRTVRIIDRAPDKAARDQDDRGCGEKHGAAQVGGGGTG